MTMRWALSSRTSESVCRGDARLAPEKRDRLGRASRAKAEVLFDVNTVVEQYRRILEMAAERRRLPVGHRPQEGPDANHV